MTELKPDLSAAAAGRRGYGRYLTGRLIEYAVVLLIALTLNFALPGASGGPLKLFGSPEALARLTADERAQIASEYGFGRPVPAQFLDYLKGVVTLLW